MIWEIDEQSHTIEGLDAAGRPRPEYAAALGLVPAPRGRRVVAVTVEIIVVLLLQLPFLIGTLPAVTAALQQPDPTGALLARPDLLWIFLAAAASSVLTSVFLLVQMILHGRRGVTLGKAITGIRSVNVRTLERPGFWRGAVVRYLVQCAAFLVPLLGPLLVIALSPLFDARGRGWPDLAAATWFVDARGGLDPYDQKRMRIARKTVATELDDVRTELPSLATPQSPRDARVDIPTARSSGGVLGAAKPDGAASPSAPDAAAWSPVAGPAASAAPLPPVAAGIVDSVPGAGARPVDAGTAAPAPAAPFVPPAPPQVAPARPAPAHSADAAPGIRLVLDTGEPLALGDGILLGRAPSETQAAAEGLRAVGIADETRSVSKLHLAVLREGTGYAVVDRGSTNGSALLRDGAEQPLTAGVPEPVRDGDTIRFGDRSITVRRA